MAEVQLADVFVEMADTLVEKAGHRTDRLNEIQHGGIIERHGHLYVSRPTSV